MHQAAFYLSGGGGGGGRGAYVYVMDKEENKTTQVNLNSYSGGFILLEDVL